MGARRLDHFAGSRWALAVISLLIILLGAWLIARLPSFMAVPALGLFVVPLLIAGALGTLLAFSRPAGQEVPFRVTPLGHALAVAAALLCAGGAVWVTRGGLVWKPFAFYGFYAAACLFVAVQAFLGPRRSWTVALSLAQASLLVLVYALVTHLLSPLGYGADTIFHRQASTALASTGRHSAITAPYSLFSGYHDVIALVIQMGAQPRLAIALGAGVLAIMTLVGAALMVGRAAGPRAAALCVGLLAATPGLLTSAATASPSKAGVWALLAAGFFALAGGAWGIVAALAFGAIAFLFHPTMGLAFLLIAATYVGLVHVLGVLAPLARVGRAFGFRPATDPPTRLRHWWVPVVALAALAGGALVWLIRSQPYLVTLLTRPLTFTGSQEGAIGAIRAQMTSDLFAQTVILNVCTSLLVIPATYACVRAFLGAERNHAVLLASSVGAIVATTGIVTGAGLFLIGAERFLALLDILLVAAASVGLLWLMGQTSRTVRVAAGLVLGVMMLVAVSSYRVDGSDLASPAVPKQTDYVAREAIVAVKTLRPVLQADDLLQLDLYTHLYMATFPSHSDATLWNDPVNRFNITALATDEPREGSVTMHSREATAREHDLDKWMRIETKGDKLYDNGLIVAGVA